MNESIFEDTFFGNGSIAGTPADEDVEELIDIPEADDESSSEGDTPSGNILELLSRMRGLMPNSDGDEDMDDNDTLLELQKQLILIQSAKCFPSGYRMKTKALCLIQ